MKCPKDSSALEPLKHNEEARQCGVCLGVLVRSADLCAQVRGHGMNLRKLHPHRFFDTPCPDCSKPMEGWVVNSAELDVCISCHSIWFDPGEIEKVRQQFENRAEPMDLKSGISWDDFGILQALLGFR